MIQIREGHPLFMTEVNMPVIDLNKEDLELRCSLLLERMKLHGLSHVILYGDREHFSTVEYFTKYDCRFEETLFVMDDAGNKSICVGNEGMGFSEIIPYEIKRYMVQNFSLQGQPRDRSKPLDEIFADMGIKKSSKVGVVGYKYFNATDIDTDPLQTYDLPEYMMTSIRKATDNCQNFTYEITGLPNGIRMKLYTAKEIAWAESAGNRCAAVVQRLFKNLKPGIREYELSMLSQVGFDPVSCHPLTNFGDESVRLGMRSPTESKLQVEKPAGLCYAIRGHLCSRVSVAAYSLDDCGELRPYIDSFYKKHFEAMCNWYETIEVGTTGGQLYEAVMSVVGGPEFGVSLNPGHHSATDEWTNSVSYKDSPLPIADGALVQADIIASNGSPVRTAICEDAVVVAGEKLRSELRVQYPEAYDRIMKRREVMKEVLGITLKDDVLPMSNLTGANFPFMLNTNLVFAK